MPVQFAIDATARTFDADGRMHINRSHISKACVNPYYGSEIPNAAMLGLDPAKIYYLLRSPEELEKAAPTFARLPILKKHIPVTADVPRPDLIVGAIGSEVEFLAPYLDADTCIWDATAIAGIETETVREFSCAYRYVAVMSSGYYQGEHYDGIMTEIQGNHLALVESGRAGPDVLAADSKLREPMKTTKLGKALIVALGTAFPKLAMDANFLPSLVGQASKKTFDRAGVKAKLIAFDKDMPVEQTDAVMDALLDVESDPEPAEPKAKGKDAKACDEETEEEKAEREKAEKKAKDKEAKDKAKDEKEEREGETKKAMDAFRADLRSAEEAKRDVRPIVGEVVAMDSASEIYSFALDHLKVDHKDVTEVPALKALFKMATNRPAATVAPRIAQDAAAGLETRFPGFNRVRHA